MEVIVGKYAGFCPGVMNSVTKAQEAVDKYEELYCLGELIHNKTVVTELEEKGMKTVDDINEVPDNSVVIFRAHGVKESIYEDAKNKNLEVIDLTCAIVKNIHEKVSDKKQDNFIIITGDELHPETIGTKDFAGDNSYVVSISKEKDVYYSNDEDGFNHIKAKSIVMATGSTERTPGAIMLEGDRVSGILTAGQAQKYLNIDGYLVGKKVFIYQIVIVLERTAKNE